MNVKSICLKNNPCLSKSNNDKLETNDVSMTDSFDVLILDNPSSIITTFKGFEANIVFGAEYFLNPDKSILGKYPEGPQESETI